MSSTGPVTAALAGIPDGLRRPLIEEFNKLLRNFRESRWEPAELNGGRFSEIVYTILKGHVGASFASAPSKPRNMVDACRALESATGFPRSVRIQIPRVLMALYEIRNNRNVGHVGSDVDPSHMDASVVLAMSQWVMAELVRIFHAVSTEEASLIVDSLIERTIPLLWRVGSKVRILNPQLGAKEKALALLYGETGSLTAREIADAIEYANVSQFRAKVLKPIHKSKLIEFDARTDSVTLSPVGVRYVEQNVSLSV
jgi:hypothetical protein